MPVIKFKEVAPAISESAFIAPDAWIIGDAQVGRNVSVFFGCVLRGDIEKVVIEEDSNIQEHSTMHTSTGFPCTVGKRVTVGHNVVLHSCTVKDDCVVGMGSTVLDGAIIGCNCIIGANSLVTMGSKIPDGTLALGSPAKVIRDLKPEDSYYIRLASKHYLDMREEYRRIFGRLGLPKE